MAKTRYTHTSNEGTKSTVNPALVVSGDIIPSEYETCSLGSIEHPFHSVSISDSTMYIGGQKSVAWGQNEQDNINYSAGSVGIGIVNPTVELDVIGELISNMYGAIEVNKMIKDGKPKKEAVNNFMQRVLGSIDK